MIQYRYKYRYDNDSNAGRPMGFEAQQLTAVIVPSVALPSLELYH
jgi:hypothetical protein